MVYTNCTVQFISMIGNSIGQLSIFITYTYIYFKPLNKQRIKNVAMVLWFLAIFMCISAEGANIYS